MVDVKKRGALRVFSGVVSSVGSDKTVAVKVERSVRHPQFRKYISRSSTFLAHNIRHECKVGDLVQIKESRPYSKMKRFTLLEVLKRAEIV